MKSFKIPILVCALTLAGFAAANQVKVELAGRVVTVDAVSVGGKTYVSLEQLKAQLGTAGGTQQLAASEGPMKFLFEMHSVKGLPFSARPSFRVDLKAAK